MHKLTLRFVAFYGPTQNSTNIVKTWVEKDKSTCNRKAANYLLKLREIGFVVMGLTREDHG